MALSKQFGDNLAGQLSKIERAAASTARAIDAMGRAADRIEAAFGRVDFSRLNSIGGSGGSASGGKGGGSSGGDLGGSLVAGLAPLASIGSQVTAQLDKVGGTIVTLARRIDDALKKPFFEKLIEDATRSETELIRVGAKAADAGLKIHRFFANFGDVAGKGLGQLFSLKGGFVALPGPVGAATSSVKRLGAEIALAVGAFALVYKTIEAGKHFLVEAVKGAVNLNETLSKTKEVFGKSTGAIVGTVDEMARRFGLVKGPLLDAASSFGLIAKGAKLTGQQTATMSTALLKAAADASSFFNVPLDVALEKIRAGLVGESEPLRAFGVLLSEDAVKAKALAEGFAKNGKAIDDQAKVMARSKLILEGLAPALGDLARTGDQPANAFRKFTGTISNLATEMGTALLPAIGKGIGLLNQFGAAAVAKWEASKEGFKGFVDQVVYGIGSIEVLFKNWPRVMDAFWLTTHEVFQNFDAAIDTLLPNFKIISNYVANNWYKLIFDAFNGLNLAVNNLLINLVKLGKAWLDFAHGDLDAFSKISWTPLLDGFKATADKLPELIKPKFVEIGKAAGKIWDEINKRQSKVAGGLAGLAGGLGRDVGKMLGGLAPEAEKKGGAAEAKDNAALSFGSKEAASAIARFTNKSDTNAQLLKIQAEALAVLRRAAAALEATRHKKGGAGDLADELNLGGI